jgi:hypothetical protein
LTAIGRRRHVVNSGDERTIEVYGQGTRYRGFQGATGVEIRQSIHLKRGDHVRVTIPVPVFAVNENMRFEILERGRVLQGLNYSGIQSGRSADDSPVLIVADPGTGVGIASVNWPRPLRSAPSRYSFGPAVSGSGSAGPKLDFLLGPTRAPANWLGYTSLRAVLIGPGEWGEFTEAQKTAVLTYVACGGKLIFADGDLKTLLPERTNSTSVSHYFLGTIQFPKTEDVTAVGLDTILSASSADDSVWSLPVNHEPDWGWIADHGFRLPIPGLRGIPAHTYLAILILFSLLIGPANFIVLWRRREQVLLVLTVPLISALFIAVLAGYAIAGEGFGVRARSETFTLLDQTMKQAATRASVSLYAAGMTPSGGLRFPRDMAIFPIGADGQGSQETQLLDLTDSQQFASGVTRARSPSNFEEIAFRPARERLAFTIEGARVAVVNGLGATVDRLLYKARGRTYSLEAPLRPGEQAALMAGDSASPQKFLSECAKRAGLSAIKLHQVVEGQKDGSYLAVLARSPFWDPGVGSIDERGSFHLVLGLTEGAP